MPRLRLGVGDPFLEDKTLTRSPLDRGATGPSDPSAGASVAPVDLRPSAVEAADLDPTVLSLGWTDQRQQELIDLARPDLLPARVTAAHRGHIDVQGSFAGRLRVPTSLEPVPATGDWIGVLPATEGHPATPSVVLRRDGVLARKAAGTATRRQIIATNLDQVWVLTSMNKDFNGRRLERYVAAARSGGVEPVVVLTKADLDYARTYRYVADCPPDVRVIVTSVVLDEGVDLLREILVPGRTIGLVGTSGVGKSTMLNALADREVQRTQPARGGDDRGKHTTTRRELFLLPGGGVIVDTPGMRELGLWGADGAALAFPELEALTAACRYRDCSHTVEAGCALLEAVEAGEVPAGRLANWQKLQRELHRNAERLHEQRRRHRRTGRMVRNAQRVKRRGDRSD